MTQALFLPLSTLSHFLFHSTYQPNSSNSSLGWGMKMAFLQETLKGHLMQRWLSIFKFYHIISYHIISVQTVFHWYLHFNICQALYSFDSITVSILYLKWLNGETTVQCRTFQYISPVTLNRNIAKWSPLNVQWTNVLVKCKVQQIFRGVMWEGAAHDSSSISPPFHCSHFLWMAVQCPHTTSAKLGSF